MRRMALLVLLALVALPAHAQISSTESVVLSITPENPRPYDTVTVLPESSLIDLASAKISVLVNGTAVVSGGVQRVPVTVGGPGDRTTIRVDAVVGGKTYTAQRVIRPADVSLITEPVSSTHPFYRGAPLIAPSGRIRVIALADLRTAPATRIAPANLVYTWSWGDRVLAEYSGIGRSTLNLAAPVRYRDAEISVTVTDATSNLIASASTFISPVDAIARIYPTDPLSGPDFDHALSGRFGLSGEEAAFRGVGYFFGAKPSLTWSINSQPASNDNEVTVRTTGSGQGSAALSLTALESTAQQSATARLPVDFGTGRSFNIFGF